VAWWTKREREVLEAMLYVHHVGAAFDNHAMQYGHHVGRGFDGHGWWWGFLGGVVPSLLLLVLIGLALWAILRFSARGAVPARASATAVPIARPDGPLDELRLRYARGEMSREDFLERSRDLGDAGSDSGPPPPPEAG
jgi:uncharacterized membrane protein